MRAGGRLWDPTSRSGLPPTPYPLRPSPRAAPNRMCVRTVRLRAYCAYVLTHLIARVRMMRTTLPHHNPRAHTDAIRPYPACVHRRNILVISTIADNIRRIASVSTITDIPNAITGRILPVLRRIFGLGGGYYPDIARITTDIRSRRRILRRIFEELRVISDEYPVISDELCRVLQGSA
jgi:hypothetical protein